MEFKQYMKKNIIAWLYYNEKYESIYGETNKRCYVYPRVLIAGNNYYSIDPNDFPNLGSIEVRIYGVDSAEDIFDRYGPLVNIRINEEPVMNDEGNNRYSLKYNYKYGKFHSEIWIEPFSGKEFYQIIDINKSIEEIQNEHSIPEPDCRIRTTLILLRYKNKLYGPFECDTKEGITILRGVKSYQYIVGEYNAMEYENDLLKITDKNGEVGLVLIPKTVISSPEKCENHQDWISEETLIDSIIDILRVENSYTHEQQRKLKEMLRQLVECDPNVQFIEGRKSKICALVQKISNNEDFAHSIVEYALKNEEIKKILAKEAVINYFDLIKDKIPELASVQERIDKLKTEEELMNRRIVERRESITNIEAESLKEAKLRIDELTQELRNAIEEKDALSEEIGIRKEIKDLIKERDQLKIDREKAKDNYNQQLIDNNELKKQFDATLKSFNDRATQTARIIDSKLLDKILIGIGEEHEEENVVKFDTSLLYGQHMDHIAIIDRVTDFINNKAHRDVSINDVANYLICITQGFITTFAGEPGTGKTSLCNILAKALGLVADNPQRRFVDISVERGWSSHKDFIGYYNPLSKKLERSNGEVFEAFERMHEECDCDQAKIAPFIILLDEANLSPIEHYWAAFLRNCDFVSVSNRSIPIGGTKSFILPEHLRFLATVNFDHTTEELSPRFCDRSWIIMLEPTCIDDSIDEEIKNAETMVSFADLKSAFSVRDDDTMDDSVQNKWKAIQKIFRDNSLQIMPRNLKMVRNYCIAACKCMECNTPATRLAPLDYALSQKILPTINGNGENYRTLIEELMKECTTQNMPVSARHLERMKRVAENNMGFFQFFSR